MRPALLVSLAGLLALAACRPGDGAVRAARAASGPVRGVFERDVLLTGELEAVRSIGIKAPQTALFQMRIQYMAEEGDAVKAGDDLLTFDSSSLVQQVEDLKSRILDAETQIVAQRASMQSTLKDLEIALAEARKAADEARLQASVDKDVLARKVWGERQLQREKTQRELDEAIEKKRLTQERGQAELDVLVIQRDKLRQDLQLAQQGLSLLNIKAPSDGVVVYERRMENNQRFAVGDSCWPGQGLLQLPDLSEMRAVLSVSEADAPLLREGMEVTAVLDAFPGRELSGLVQYIPSMAVRRSEDSRLNVFRVQVALSQTWIGEMKPGMSVRARIVVERIEDAPLLPRSQAGSDDGSYWWPRGVPKERGIQFRPLARNATHYLLSPEDHDRLAGAKAGSA